MFPFLYKRNYSSPIYDVLRCMMKYPFSELQTEIFSTQTKWRKKLLKNQNFAVKKSNFSGFFSVILSIHIFIMFIFSFTEKFVLSSSISQTWELSYIVPLTSNFYFEFSTCQNNIVTTEKNYSSLFLICCYWGS